jgi:hypothetical protein
MVVLTMCRQWRKQVWRSYSRLDSKRHCAQATESRHDLTSSHTGNEVSPPSSAQAVLPEGCTCEAADGLARQARSAVQAWRVANALTRQVRGPVRAWGRRVIRLITRVVECGRRERAFMLGTGWGKACIRELDSSASKVEVGATFLPVR